jgi:uncharacterized protein YvpB/LysM repeat protein
MRRLTLPLLVLYLVVSLVLPSPVRADPIPRQAYIKGVSGNAQTYRLSCESRSAVDWAAYWGVNIRERKFLNNLPRSDNPETGFVGSPNGEWGNIPPAAYGVHAQPVAALLREFGLEAQARRNMTWDELRIEIAAGRPVIVWIIGEMWGGSAQKYRAANGEVVAVARFEHTVIVTGYNADTVRIIDAYTGQTRTYARKAFLNSWRVLGNMAVTGGRGQTGGSAMEPPPAQPTPTPPSKPPVDPRTLTERVFIPAVYGGSTQIQSAAPAASADRYTVKRGDYLSAVANKFGLDWGQLARLNGLSYPYTIYAGQVLKLK